MNIFKKLRNITVYLSWMKRLWHPGKKTAYFLGTPEHGNLGDSAIVIAQKQFLNKYGYEKIVEVTSKQLWNEWKCIQRVIPKERPIYLIGGGNMGNQWMQEEILRRKLIQEYSNNPMVVFPQTIHYTPDAAGAEEALVSISTYNRKPELTIVAREKRSFETMQQLYPNARILLTPDIVLSSTMETFGVKPQEREGVLLCMRSDAERAMSDGERASIEKAVAKFGHTYRYMDMYSDGRVQIERREECVRVKMQEFCGAQLVITDRLHGMIFSALTGTPCIVFSNYNHKVQGTYEWIEYLPYIRYAESAEEAERLLPELLSMKECEYDNTPLKPYFEELEKVIKEHTEE